MMTPQNYAHLAGLALLAECPSAGVELTQTVPILVPSRGQLLLKP